ncbi:MAG: (2Fe-2S)-binding protein [Rhodoferax sp.]|nr:(2Fe-2S)-binding protein [Rhodoferax sp.]
MFRPIDSTLARPGVTLLVQGQPITARVGETLAMALLNAGVVPFRKTPVSGQPRAPLCLMGACFDCLVEVDGQQNVQSCMVEVSEGMQVRLPTGARRAEDAA